MKLLAAAFELPKPIRPRHCEEGCDGTGRTMYDDGTTTPDPYCDGLGFLYPDPPEWWGGTAWWKDLVHDFNRKPFHISEWEAFCVAAWRVLGVVEVDDE
jgi:hypothetical protein